MRIKKKTKGSDPNKRMRLNMKIMIFTIVAAYLYMMGYFAYTITLNGSKWLASSYNNKIAIAKNSITPGNILDRNGVVLATTDKDGDRVYEGSEEFRLANSHAIGDSSGAVASGAETLFSMDLLGLDYNNSVSIITQIRENEDKRGNDVTLTIDSKLNQYIYEAMGNYSGAVVLMNYKTGEVYALVSKPGFDANNISKYLTDDESSDSSGSQLVNRATLGRYTPGSVFKIITATAALRYVSNVDTITYSGANNIIIGGVKVTNYGGEAFGSLDLAEAFAESCNTFFGQIAQDIGGKNLLETAERLKFNTDFSFSDFVMAKSSYVYSDQAGDLAWSAIGQYKDTVSPLHMAMIVSGIANDGVMMEPKLFLKSTNSSGQVLRTLKSSAYATIMERQEAFKMKTLMYGVISSGTGTSCAISGYKIGGKTGTAEVDSSGNTKTHAWFVAFINDDQHPLAIAVVLENAGTGGSKAAPVAKKAFVKAMALGY